MKISPGLIRFSTIAICITSLGLIVPQLAPKGALAALTGEIRRVHDPSRIVKCEGKYYVFYTGDKLPVRTSTDMVNWTAGRPVLEKVPDSLHGAVPDAKGDFVWAPDVMQVKGEYWVFYSYSTFGSQTSAIGLVSSPTLNPDNPAYKWTDRGIVIASNSQVGYNAIDPAPVWDSDGKLWMTFGSWHREGIQVVQLNTETGKPIGEPVTIAKGQAQGPEAPYLHFRDGYYYQFENEGECCKAMNSTYRVVVGRSKSITGPYLDKAGKDLNQAGGTMFLETSGAEIGPGHIGIFGEGGIEQVTFHFYDGRANGTPTLARRTLVWGADGWPLALPDLKSGQYDISSKTLGTVGLSTRNFPNGLKVNRAGFTKNVAQKWNVIALNDGYFSIASLANGKYLHLAEGSDFVDLQPWQDNDSQHWRIEPTGVGTYRISSKANQRAFTWMDAEGDGEPKDVTVNSAWQNWEFNALP